MHLIDQPMIISGLSLSPCESYTYREFSAKLGLGINQALLDTPVKTREHGECLYGDLTPRHLRPVTFDNAPLEIVALEETLRILKMAVDIISDAIPQPHMRDGRAMMLGYCMTVAFSGYALESQNSRARLEANSYIFPNGLRAIEVLERFTAELSSHAHAVISEEWSSIFGADPSLFLGEKYALAVLSLSEPRGDTLRAFADKVPAVAILPGICEVGKAYRESAGVWLLPEAAYNIWNARLEDASAEEMLRGHVTSHSGLHCDLLEVIAPSVDPNALAETTATFLRDSMVSAQMAYEMALAIEK